MHAISGAPDLKLLAFCSQSLREGEELFTRAHPLIDDQESRPVGQLVW